MLYLYIFSLLLEIIITAGVMWRLRLIIAGLVVSLTGFSAFGMLIISPNWLTAGILVLALFRVFNMFRIVKGRMHTSYLKHAARRTTGWLLIYHLVLAGCWLINGELLTGFQAGLPYAWGVLAVSAIVLLTTIRNIVKTRHLPVAEHYADRDLPSVTVAVPARNETLDLEDMIRTIIASNYPKLEVIVLDDCSADKTPEIIRQFAHDGVRFMPGYEPEPRWLAKNWAYEKLAQEANGELILFAGVDVRFGPEAIRALVITLLTRKKSMISVLPRRLAGTALDAIIQPMRYWWELTLPRRLFNRPAVLSTCWLIKRKVLEDLGGFSAVSHSIIPEGYFARELVKRDGYSFIRADDELDIQTRKSPAEQISTAVRMRYPQFRRRPEWVLLAVFVHVSVLILPIGIALSSVLQGFSLIRVLAMVVSLLFIVIHVIIVQASNPSNTLVAIINLPLAAISELVLTLASMYQYEFSVVEWKGRNITPPVMHVIPHLPKLSD